MSEAVTEKENSMADQSPRINISKDTTNMTLGVILEDLKDKQAVIEKLQSDKMKNVAEMEEQRAELAALRHELQKKENTLDKVADAQVKTSARVFDSQEEIDNLRLVLDTKLALIESLENDLKVLREAFDICGNDILQVREENSRMKKQITVNEDKLREKEVQQKEAFRY